MIDVRINAPAIEHLEFDGEVGVVAFEVASVCALYYAELKKHNKRAARTFQSFMQRMVQEDSPLWSCPPLESDSEFVSFPKI